MLNVSLDSTQQPRTSMALERLVGSTPKFRRLIFRSNFQDANFNTSVA